MPMITPRRIFIVDDDSEVISLMSTLLEARGHIVRSNLVGDQAIPQIVDMRPHCVLVDLMMAAIDGYALSAELKKRRELADMKIVMVSARTGAIWTERSQAVGLDGYITKPIDIATFAQQVESFFP
jgi:two-component system cell cycle response regulator DivK